MSPEQRYPRVTSSVCNKQKIFDDQNAERWEESSLTRKSGKVTVTHCDTSQSCLMGTSLLQCAYLMLKEHRAS